MKQKDIILKHLLEHRTITSYESFDIYGILDLQSVIRTLRKTYNIKDTWIHTTNRYGNKVQYKKYWLEEEEDEK